MNFVESKTAYFMDKLRPYLQRKVKDRGVDDFDEGVLHLAIYRFLAGEVTAQKSVRLLNFITDVPNLEWVEIVDEMNEAKADIERQSKSGQ
ncbi:MAG: hypothetical protein V3U54_08785 [Thermodesulfobacteriota bacterium]